MVWYYDYFSSTKLMLYQKMNLSFQGSLPCICPLAKADELGREAGAPCRLLHRVRALSHCYCCLATHRKRRAPFLSDDKNYQDVSGKNQKNISI